MPILPAVEWNASIKKGCEKQNNAFYVIIYFGFFQPPSLTSAQNYKAVRKVNPPKITPAELGIIRIQSFFGSLVHP